MGLKEYVKKKKEYIQQKAAALKEAKERMESNRDARLAQRAREAKEELIREKKRDAYMQTIQKTREYKEKKRKHTGFNTGNTGFSFGSSMFGPPESKSKRKKGKSNSTFDFGF